MDVVGLAQALHKGSERPLSWEERAGLVCLASFLCIQR